MGTFSLAAHNEDIGALTPTEAVALEGYSAGLTRAEIATSLGLSARKRGYIVGPPFLIIDELGYLPMDRAAANWLFHVVSRRYERGSIILTCNRGFADWAQIFNDAVVATAIVDRLLHRATVINIRGHSYSSPRSLCPRGMSDLTY